MTPPNSQTLYDVIDGTWPAAKTHVDGPFIIRQGSETDGQYAGLSGGQRVTAATITRPVTDAEIPTAEAAMRALGQSPLFMIRDGDGDLDDMLAARGYAVHDPVNLYAAPIDDIATQLPPPVTAFCIWEPLAMMHDIWKKGGIDAGRVAVMHRVMGAKTGLMGRLNEHPAAAGFIAIHDDIAMLHALEILPHQRRQNMATYAMRQAAFWARDNGATHMSLLVTKANIGANALYASLGMTIVGQYHYRKHLTE